MGYYFYITRRELWSDPDDFTPNILPEEWEEICDADPSLHTGTVTAADGESFGEATGLARIWVQETVIGAGTVRGAPNASVAWFEYDEKLGEISVRSPDHPTRLKMYALAQLLDAHVQGEEGERYGADGDPVDSV